MVLENLLRAKLGRATWAPLAAVVALFATSSTPANAMKIQTIKSPGGIEAWLVEELAELRSVDVAHGDDLQRVLGEDALVVAL